MLVWKGFEYRDNLLSTLKSTFESFSVMFPQAAEHLTCVDGYCNFSDPTTIGQISDGGTKIEIRPMFDEDVNRTFVHELGHLLHLYLENSSVSKIIYKFTTRNRPRKLSDAPSQYSLQDRLEAFADGFREIWFSPKGEWSLYTRKLNKIINILKSKCRMSSDLIKRAWGWFSEFLISFSTSAYFDTTYYCGTSTLQSTATTAYFYTGASTWC